MWHGSASLSLFSPRHWVRPSALSSQGLWSPYFSFLPSCKCRRSADLLWQTAVEFKKLISCSTSSTAASTLKPDLRPSCSSWRRGSSDLLWQAGAAFRDSCPFSLGSTNSNLQLRRLRTVDRRPYLSFLSVLVVDVPLSTDTVWQAAADRFDSAESTSCRLVSDWIHVLFIDRSFGYMVVCWPDGVVAHGVYRH